MMNKVKLLFVLPSLVGGGAERITCNLIDSLDKDKFYISLFLFNKEGVYWDILPENINVIYANTKGKNSKLIILKELYKSVKDVDIVISCMELMPTYFSVLIGKFLGKKVIGWVHINIDSILNDKKKYIRLLHKYILIKLFYNYLDKVIAVSNGVEESIKKYLIYKNKFKLECIYNPIKIDYIRKKALESCNESFDRPLIMGIGRLERQKNFILLIRAHKLLLDKGIKQNLVILGEGSQREYLLSQIKKMDLDKTVKLLGFRNNPYKYLKKADIFVQSSLYEGLPTVLIEALALNVPVIATNCPDGAEEILSGGKYGLLVESNNLENLSAGIRKLLMDKELINTYKNKSINAVNKFDEKNVVKLFEKMFLDINNLY